MGRHWCVRCSEEICYYDEDPCPNMCERAADTGDMVCESCIKLVTCGYCGLQGCDHCVGKVHCASCKLPACGKCQTHNREQITFGCGHTGCAGPAIRALGLHNFGPAIGADELAEDEKPLCPGCQRADTAKARATVAKAKAEQLRRDLPDDVALVRTMLPRVKTGQLRRALAEWLANPAAPRKRPRQS